MFTNIIIFIINRCFAPIVEGYFIATIGDVLLERRYKSKLIKLSVIFSLAIAIEVTTMLDPSKTLATQLFMLFFIILIMRIFYKGSTFKVLISYGLCMVMIIVSEALTATLLILVTGLNFNILYTNNYYYAWAVIISKSTQLMMLRILMSKLKKDIRIPNIYKIYTIILMFLCISIIFILTELLLIDTIDKSHVEPLKVISFLLLMVILLIFVILIFLKITKETKKQIEQKQLLEQYQLEHKYSKELNKILDNLRILKHDLKNHISCMWGLIETDNIEDFKSYLLTLLEEIDELDEGKYLTNIKKQNK